MTSSEQARHIALRQTHLAAGAMFEDIQGWSLPAHYGSAESEYRALRSTAVAFDHSHRSRFLVTGTDALVVLGRAFAGHLDEL